MYFILLTNYLNYVAFDEALTLLGQLKKAIVKITKGATLWKQPLGNILFYSASSAGINKASTCENKCLPNVCLVLLLLPWALVELGPLHHLR